MILKNFKNKLYKVLKYENLWSIILLTVVLLIITYQYTQVKHEVKEERIIVADHQERPIVKRVIEEVNEDEFIHQEEEQTETYIFEVTKYTAECNGCIGITKSGYDVRNTVYYEDYRIVACDPNVIPLHTVLEIEGYQRQFICLDTGGMIKGMKLDILTDSYTRAIEWGRQKVEVNIVDYGS